jgi:hypothetical protein
MKCAAGDTINVFPEESKNPQGLSAGRLVKVGVAQLPEYAM